MVDQYHGRPWYLLRPRVYVPPRDHCVHCLSKQGTLPPPPPPPLLRMLEFGLLF